jgi:hypothetical protein
MIGDVEVVMRVSVTSEYPVASLINIASRQVPSGVRKRRSSNRSSIVPVFVTNQPQLSIGAVSPGCQWREHDRRYKEST